MATEVDICNLALSRLGDEANVASINPAEGSDQADHCARFYPLARNTMLAQHAWTFTLARARLAEISVADNLSRFAHAYALPNNCMRVLRLVNTSMPWPLEGTPFEVVGTTLYTDVEGAIVEYQEHKTDPSLFPPLFVDALAWLLASYLAGSIIQGEAAATIQKNCAQYYAQMLAQARSFDAPQFNDRDISETYRGDIARSRL